MWRASVSASVAMRVSSARTDTRQYCQMANPAMARPRPMAQSAASARTRLTTDLRVDDEAMAAAGLYEVGSQLAPQARDVHVEHVGRRLVTVAVEMRQQF